MTRLFVAALSGAALLTAGCASIFDGRMQTLPVATNVQGATVVITNKAGAEVYSGPAPAEVRVARGRGFFKSEEYTVTVSAPGYSDQEVRLAAGINAWYFGNILFGGLIGLIIVDPLTGAIYTHRPKEIDATLTPAPTAALDAAGESAARERVDGEEGAAATLRIMSLGDVPAEMRASLKRLDG